MSTIRIIAGMAFIAGTSASLAHDGHGLAGTHWHATDSFGLLLVGLLAGLAAWLARGRK